MKKGMKRNLRRTLLYLLPILAGIMLLLSFDEVKNPAIREEKTPNFKYIGKSDVNYTVFLKPNILHPSSSMEEGRAYITNFVDNIKATFKYNFEGDQTADINGDYEVIALLEGFVTAGEEDSVKIIWGKEFKVIPKTNFSLKNKKFSLLKDIPININQYNELVTNIIQSSNINSSTRLSYSLKVNLKAKTEKGLVEDRQSPTIMIPLRTNYFEIVKSGVEEKPGVIEETKKVILPVNKKLVIAYGLIAVIALSLLIYLIFFTVGTKEDPLIKNLNNIFKKHGDRLVAINNEIDLITKTCYKVNTIDDLVRVADDLERPILYTYNFDLKKMSSFYVIDENNVYIFNLMDTYWGNKSHKLENKVNLVKMAYEANLQETP